MGRQSKPAVASKSPQVGASTSISQISPHRILYGIGAAVCILGCLVARPWDNAVGWGSTGSSFADWDQRREDVKDVFISSWDAYSKNAWGYDMYHPVSQRGSQMSPKGLGWIIIDTLDTLMIMNLTDRLAEPRKWLQRQLDYDQDQDVNTFETTIRILGGLLSAHYLSSKLPGAGSRRDSVYLTKAIELGERLLPAYDSATGVPFASVNLGKWYGIKSHSYGGVSTMAEAGTVQLEMKYLAQLTGNETYWRTAEKVIEVFDSNAMPNGLLPIYINQQSGTFPTAEVRLGSRGDSYYEYLIKQYLQTSGQEPVYQEMWEEALWGIQQHLVTTAKHSKLKFIAELPEGIGGKLSPKMDHLVCFLPGTIALGATGGLTLTEARKTLWWNEGKEQQMKLAKDLMKTCWAMYAVTETGLAPEIAWFETDEDDLSPVPGDRSLETESDSLAAWKKDIVIKPDDAHNLQRPETVESLFMMWRITEDPLYRVWGWKIFKAFKRHLDAGEGKGYTSLNDVNAIPASPRDSMESFWLAETLKYLYLLFSPNDFLPLDEIVFSTEAHVFPRFTPKWKTGWRRNR